ncbi:alpha/beta fold hydrolase [Mycobacterium sp. EPa45]|uniref:alpha/beta fold hydrolase n=1 Tax=Mycobacterium sp. EPa45 TaxID=1545728 RepID=UPI000641FFB9|nr:alpha/beta fold hydrolase [Mycobacterium sp. EPa45]AKK26094.1 alpha/beta hydrolase [Mycobacterium sp. EPa45]
MRIIRAGAGRPPLVFVHGFACDGTDWRAQLDSLAPRTTVIVCDLPGHGPSPVIPAECTIEAFGAGLANVLAELALPPAILVGHSMGCRVVLEANRVRPDLVSGLVLVDGSRIAAGDPAAARQAMADEIAGDGYPLFVRQFFESMFFPASDPALAEAIVERALRLPATVGRALMTDLAGWDADRVEGALDGVTVPLLVIQSTTMDAARERISLTSDSSSGWVDLVRAHVPQAVIARLHGSDHFPHIALADEVTRLIADFASLEPVSAER